jgi:AAA+ superfamily predicted ATPase
VRTRPGSEGDLFAALRRLDDLLARAVQQAQALYGPGAAADPYRGLHVSDGEAERLLVQAPGAPTLWAGLPATDTTSVDQAAPMAWLTRTFALSSFDVDVVLIALAPEVDLRYERLYAYLQDDVTRKRASVDLVLNLLCDSRETKLARRAHFAPHAPLVHSGLLRLQPEAQNPQASLLAHFLKVDEQIARWLLGEQGLDTRLAPYCHWCEPCHTLDDLQLRPQAKQALLALAQRAQITDQSLKLYFHGRHGAGKRCTAEALAKATNVPLLRVDLRPASSDNAELTQILDLSRREARFRHAMLFVEGLNAVSAEKMEPALRRLFDGADDQFAITIVAGDEPESIAAHGMPGVISVAFEMLDFAKRRICWESSLGASAHALNGSDVDALAQRYRLTPGQISDAVDLARCHALWEAASQSEADGLPAGGIAPNMAGLLRAARAQTGHSLAKLARKVAAKYTWDDLVLPTDQRDQLRELCIQFTQRHVVYGAWGFERKLSLGKGLNCLFSGPPGTGKTMAAEVIANELQLDLYKIDLSQVVSKYIGETEKNLDRIFSAAEDANGILFFDEADALFGKRSEAKDAHDRYANIEVGYLLQKMEEYEGVAILATNLKSHLDDAFLRRLQVIVEFPLPDEEYRRYIWQGVFPREAPLGDDVDFSLLARAVRLAGGNIKNIGLASAFYAAGDGGVIRMLHVVRAVRREHQKLGRTWSGLD